MSMSYNLHPAPILKWLPRILAMIYIVFISLFALDVFGQNFSFMGLFMHLLPSIFLTICLLVAWRHELVGAVLFGSFAIAYFIVISFHFSWMNFSIIGLPLFVIGALFFLSRLAKIDIELVEVLDAAGDKTGAVLTKNTAQDRGVCYKKMD